MKRTLPLFVAICTVSRIDEQECDCLTDYELLEKLKNSDLTVLQNVQALFELGKLLNDKSTVTLARSKANAIALIEKSADAL